MADRTFKLYGKAYGTSVSITVNLNSTQVFSGTVPSVEAEVDSTIAWADMDELCSFTASTDISGNTPLTISVSGGDLVYHTLHCNYFGPIGAGETLETSTVDSYNDVSAWEVDWGTSAGTCGKSNVTIDGIAQDGWEAGYRVYSITIHDGSTLACDTYVSEAVLTDAGYE